MKKVLSLLKPYRLQMAMAWFFMLVELAVELVHPMLLSKVIDAGVIPKNTSVIVFYGTIMIIISIISFVGGILNSFFSSHVGQSYGYDLREHLFKKLQSFSFANFNQFRTSTLITRMTNDVMQMQNTVFMALRIMVKSPLMGLGSLIMAFVIDARLALFLLITMPILIPFLLWVMKRGGQLFKLVQEKVDGVNGVMRENLTGMRLIKAFIRRNHESDRFRKANNDLKDHTVKALVMMQTVMPILLLVMNLAVLGVLWFGHLQITQHQIKVGEVVAIINYGTRMTATFSMLANIIMVLSRARASANRIGDVLDTEIDLVDVEDGLEPVTSDAASGIIFDHVAFHYPNTKSPVLKDLSFEIKQGETIAILGGTGSGKTSLFQLIPRLYDVDEGRILVDHQDIRYIAQEKVRQMIGFVPQESLLFTGTLRDNIAWGKEEASIDAIVQAAKDAQIHDTILHLPNGYDTRIGQKGVNLSGGQKQRVSIARALVRKPKILLLDDSTSALDLKTEANLLEAIKKYTCTTLIITQKISTAMEADKILILEDGKLLAMGTHKTLLNTSDLYQQIYYSQYGEGDSLHA